MQSSFLRIAVAAAVVATSSFLSDCTHAVVSPTPVMRPASEGVPLLGEAHGVIAEYRTLTPSSGPSKVALGSDGNIWFSEINVDNIGRITPSGTITEFPITKAGCPTRVALGSDQNIWFALGCSNGYIGRITTSGLITTYAIPTVHGGPNGITSGPDGRLWFTEQNVDKIGATTTTGSFTEYQITSGAYPLDITSGPDGNLWFTEFMGNKIGRMTTTGAFQEFSIPTKGSFPSGITTGPDGNLWFAEQGVNQVGKITLTGSITEFPLPLCGGPYQLTSAPDGKLYIVCSGPSMLATGPSQIASLTTSGRPTYFEIPTAGASPIGIAMGGDGNLWFTEYNPSKIGVFSFR